MVALLPAKDAPIEVCLSLAGASLVLPAKEIFTHLEMRRAASTPLEFDIGRGAIARILSGSDRIHGFDSPKEEGASWNFPIARVVSAAELAIQPRVYAPPTQLSEADFVLLDNELLHLGIHPDLIPNYVIVVGDPARPATLAKEIGLVDILATADDAPHRRLPWVIGTLPDSDLRIGLITHQMGVGSAEIALGEILRAANYTAERTLRDKPRETTVIRFGTCGLVNPVIAKGTPIISTCAVGTDWTGLAYDSTRIADSQSSGEVVRNVRLALMNSLPQDHPLLAGLSLYGASPDPDLFEMVVNVAKDLGIDVAKGPTFNAQGFFETQGRPGPYPLAIKDLVKTLYSAGISHIEMESGPVTAQCQAWRARGLVVTVGVAQRTDGTFVSKDEYPLANSKSVALVMETIKRLAALDRDRT